MTNGLEVISSGLLNTLVGGNGGVPGGTGEVLAILVGDVLALGVLVALGKTEINDVDVVAGGVRTTDQEVIGLDITMDNTLLVNLFNTSDELSGDHEDGLEVEVTLARLEEILKGGSQQVHHHHVELVVGHRAVRTNVVEAGHTSYRLQQITHGVRTPKSY